MSENSFESLFRHHFPHQPTKSQALLVKKISTFLFSPETEAFILRGYAGTGKTSFIGTLIKILPQLRMKYFLLAPTGRAAKVLSNYSGARAFTIHKKIYRQKKGSSGSMVFVRNENLHANTIFIVDEASMISMDTGEFGRRSLLDDLIGYVKQGQHCKILFIGDVAQLPPVGSSESPALSGAVLRANFDLQVDEAELTDVVRQEKESGILYNATAIRNLIGPDQKQFPKLITNRFKDVYRMSGERLEDGLNYAYDHFGMEGTAVICRSNKQANQYNQNIRKRILWREEELSGGDLIMVVKNNYFWLPEDSPAGFIANGDIAEVLKVKGYSEMYGFRYATAVLRLIDYPDEQSFEAKVMLDTLMMDSPALPYAEGQKLFDLMLEDHSDEPDRKKKIEKVKADPYYNALQIKFAYAFTCHKAQGGQWEIAFVDQGYLTEEMVNPEYLRWLYTAFTRPRKELYLLNFSELFF